MIILYIFFLIFIFSFFSLAPFVPTRTSDLKRVNKISDLKDNQNFLEIWFWTAKVSFYLAKNNPNSNIVWIELSPILYFYAKIKLLFFPLKNLKLIYWNALSLNFNNYDVFYIFWLEETLKYKILPKLNLEMKKWSKLLSYCFIMDWWEKEIIKHKESENVLSIYEYKNNS